MSKVDLITGITGQDGSYLSELLLSKGYNVHGIVRRVAFEDENHRLSRIKHILKDVTLHAGSLESYASLFNIILKIKPDEVYHLAAQSYVGYSFEDEFSTLNINVNGTHYLLSAAKEFADNKVKFYFAGTSEMFGKVKETPQNENTPFNPRSSYGISKVTAYHLIKNYREAYNLHASSGILFNHESPRRGFEFVTRKISHAVARIKKGAKEKCASIWLSALPLKALGYSLNKQEFRDVIKLRYAWVISDMPKYCACTVISRSHFNL